VGAASQASGILSCSFCGRPHTEIKELIAGPGVYICDECVASGQQILSTSIRQNTLGQRADDVDAVLGNLPRIARVSALVDRNLTGWVRRARELGATWDRIGHALGITGQSARVRFSRE
jgi:hypothetical protein